MSEPSQPSVRGLRQVDEVEWELPASAPADMGVSARVFAHRELIGQIAADRSLEQLQNAATVPGILAAALAMPDIHQGYGFPVGGALKLVGAAFNRVLVQGPGALLADRGVGTEEDVEHTESEGRLDGADPATVSGRARVRGSDQLGTLGAGNHFLELQRVAKLFDHRADEVFGLAHDQVTVLIRSGSRGFGHQVCTDCARTTDAWLGATGAPLRVRAGP